VRITSQARTLQREQSPTRGRAPIYEQTRRTSIGLDQLDLFLIHWPLDHTAGPADYVRPGRAMTDIVAAGDTGARGRLEPSKPAQTWTASIKDTEKAPAVKRVELGKQYFV